MASKKRTRPDAVAIAVLRGSGDEATVLLLRRRRGAFGGAWTLVMGVVEDDETGVDAARRELFEETGLTLTTLYTAGEMDAFYDPVKDAVVHVPFFVARVAEGDVVLEEHVHGEHRWVSIPRAREMVEFPAQARILEEIRQAFVLNEPAPWRVIR